MKGMKERGDGEVGFGDLLIGNGSSDGFYVPQFRTASLHLASLMRQDME
jgi:hypothetical protein